MLGFEYEQKQQSIDQVLRIFEILKSDSNFTTFEFQLSWYYFIDPKLECFWADSKLSVYLTELNNTCLSRVDFVTYI